MYLVFLIGLAVFAIWLITGVVEGVLDAQKRPTEPMEWCYKHGFFRKKHVLEFMGCTVCPRCYYQAFKDVEKQA